MPETKITDVKVPLLWAQAKVHCAKVKTNAARQFMSVWAAHKDREDPELRWGEEVEYFLVDLSDGQAKVALCAADVLLRLGSETGGEDPETGAGWRTEYGNMMVEGVTFPPFAGSLDEILKIEPALQWRRRHLQRVASEVCPAVRVVTLAAFPLLGVAGCTSPQYDPSPDGQISKSLLCPDEVTSPHPRYKAFTANYRERKGCKVGALIPREGIKAEQRLSPGDLEAMPFRLAEQGNTSRDPVPGYIYLDSQAFGAGQCCMQATFLAPNLAAAQFLTDQFLVLAPLFLALTAATPFLRGLVADTDTRWPAFKQTWDDRTREELGLEGDPSKRISKSRTSGNGLFIDERHAEYNDVPAAKSAEAETVLRAEGLADKSPCLAQHVAHLLVRDPLMVFEDTLDVDDKKAADHWEQLQGTNWGSARFKPPPPGQSDIGWRVEFRSPEVQITDFENAAIVAVIRALAEAILDERWELTIPISLCNENEEAACERDAARAGSFWFRTSIAPASPTLTDGNSLEPLAKRQRQEGVAPKKQSLAEILAGEQGLFKHLRRWLDSRCSTGACTPEARAQLERYLELFEARASGKLPTPASFLRSLLRRHPACKGDGVVPPAFVHDLCKFATGAHETAPRPQELNDLVGELSS